MKGYGSFVFFFFKCKYFVKFIHVKNIPKIVYMSLWKFENVIHYVERIQFITQIYTFIKSVVVIIKLHMRGLFSQ